MLAWISVYADTGSTRFRREGVGIHIARCLGRRAGRERVAGGSVQTFPEPPDSRRLFRAIRARIEADEADVSAPEVPFVHPDSPQTSVAKDIYRR